MIRIKNKQYNILGGFLGWMWFALIVIPIYYIVVTSLRDQSEIYSENPLSLPKHFTFDAYGRVFANDFLRYIGNTLFVTVVTVALILLVTVPMPVPAQHIRSSSPAWPSRCRPPSSRCIT